MKVVVLDDEEKVCSLVCALILWDELGLELVGTAGDGLEGLELIRTKNPDILITDIRMPSLDGLELIKEAKKVNPALQVIIISGYRQFDYAKKAIKFGVSDYLLKPIKQNELIAALKKMVEIHNENKNYKNYLSNRDGLKSYYLTNYLETENNLSLFSELFKFSDYISLSIISVDGEFYNFDNKAKEAIRNKLIAAFSPYLEDINDWDLVYVEKFHSFILIASFEVIQKDDIIANLRTGFKEAVHNFSSLFSNLELYFSQGSLISDSDDILKEVKNVLALSYTRIFNKSNSFIQNSGIRLFVNETESDKFILAINSLFAKEELDEDEFNKIIEKVYHLDESQFFLTVEDIVNRLKVLFESQIDSEDFTKIPFDRLYFLNTVEDIINYLNTNLLKIYNLIMEKRMRESVKPIRDAQSIIQQNYFDNQLSLDYVSAQVHLSSTYFSALFKKELGKGFAEYLREIRIEKSTELLISTSLPIKEISKKVGYQDPRYFTKCFKTQYGIKPQDYRKLYG
jgi:two-component system response regulator YesN